MRRGRRVRLALGAPLAYHGAMPHASRPRRPARPALAALAACSALAGSCSEPARERSAANATGAEVFRVNCAACHGPQGEGSSMGLGPRLVGLAEHWTVERLVEYVDDPAAFAAKDPRLGQRPMPAIARSVSAADRRALAEHVLRLMR